MRRSLASLLILTASGCAFGDGDPWGRAEFTLRAAFDPPASRLDDGQLRTAKDFRVQLDDVEVTFAAIDVELSTSGEAASFDPAEPPAGYSLCHNGHCHADDGSLVDYKDVEVAQSGGDFLVEQAIDKSVALGSVLKPVSLGECTDDCRLERGELGLVRLQISDLHLTGTVTDIRDRLTEPLDLDVDIPLDSEIASAVSGTIAPGEPGRAIIGLDFQLPPGFLDNVDFANDAIDAESLDFSEALDVDVELQDQ